MTDFIAAKAIVPNEGRFLMVKHSYDGEDCYDLPGGRREPGESLEETVARESMEEACLELRVRGKVGEYHARRHDGKTVDCTVFFCEADVSTLDTSRNPADTENITGYAWVDPYRCEEYPMGDDLKRFLMKLSWHDIFTQHLRSRR